MKIKRLTGLSSCGNADPGAAFFEAFAEAGISAVELSCSSDPARQPDLRKVRREAYAAGILVWSMHLPFMPFQNINIASPDRELRGKSVNFLADLIRAGGEIGVPTFVIHPSGEPIPPELRREQMKCSQDSLSKLAPVAASVGATLAVEDLPRTCLGNCSQDILELLTADPRLRVCFDTNHLLGETIADFVRRVGKYIVTVHVSDYDFIDEKHWMPGEGKIDWVELMDLLDEIDYRGVFLYELGLCGARAPERIRPLTYRDFPRNHAELDARAPITVLKK